MNLRQLQNFRPQFDEMKVIGRGLQEGDAVSELVGMTRKGTAVTLYALQFDGNAREAQLLAEEEALCRPHRRKKETRRQEQFGGREIEPRFPFDWLRSFQMGGKSHIIGGSSSGPVGEGNWRKILLLEEFLRRGYHPCEALECRGLAALTLTEYRLDGTYRKIPLPREAGPLIVTTGRDSWENRCHKRLRLEVGRGSSRARVLIDDRTGESHRFFIEGLSLTDPWVEFEQNFQDPRLLERMGGQELEEMRRRSGEALEALCPKGMRLPAVEYEAEAEISLEFFHTEWLDAPPDPPCQGSATGIIMMSKADRKTGRHGMPLKAATVHSPVPPDTIALNLEILRWHEQRKEQTLVL